MFEPSSTIRSEFCRSPGSVLEAPRPKDVPRPTTVEGMRLNVLVERRRYPDRTFRLACQLVPTADLVVRKTGVVRED